MEVSGKFQVTPWLSRPKTAIVFTKLSTLTDLLHLFSILILFPIINMQYRSAQTVNWKQQWQSIA
jgi:hypothetical protein